MQAPEPVALTVSHIRQRIFETVRPEPPEPGPGAAAGRLFHLCAASVVDRDRASHWERVLTADDDGAARLAGIVYDTVLGPELSRCRTGLAGDQLLLVWRAVQAFTTWFVSLADRARQRGAIRYDPKREVWEGATGLFRSEVELARRFLEPGWSAPVMVSGVADHLVRIDELRWCIVEFKLGRGHEEADALQACLYHEILAGGDQASAAALVRFGDAAPEQILFSAAQIRQVRTALMNLIGALAGVTGGAPAPVAAAPAASPKQAWPKAASEAEHGIGRQIIKALAEFKSNARLSGEPIVGPAYVRFFVQPERGVSTAKLRNQGANLQVRLGAAREPVIHTVDGRIAIDVARPSRDIVPFRDLQDEIPSGGYKAVVGMDLSGKVVFLDFTAPEHAHVLVAGVAGSGKSEWLRTALASLLVANTPQTLRLALIDPKRNAFADLAHSPFLLRPGALLYPPQDDVLPLLDELIEEMERRTLLIADSHADDLAGYCRNTGARLPRIVVACDEFADLVMASRQQRAAVELALNRLGQKARAAGIHLMIATQTPRREVITGILRANTPVRVGLRVTTAVESRLILDRGGAEKLLGRGDLLFASNHDPIRLQAPYLPDADRAAIFGSG